MLFWHLLGRENAHIRSSMLRFSLGRSFKIAIVIQFFCFLEVCSFGICSVTKNAHIRQINCGFSVCESLKIPLFIRFQESWCENLSSVAAGVAHIVRYATEDTS